jgi:hypothetical protein
MDYIMHNPRSSGHYDPVHSASNHWMSHSHNSPSYPWQTQNPSLPQSYPHHPLQPAPGPGPDPFQLGHHHGGILPPMLGLPHPHAFSENMPGAISPRPSGRHQTYHRSAMPPPVAPVASGTGAHSRDGAFANQIPGRPLSFQPPAGLGIPPPGAGAGAAPEPNSQQQQQQRPPFLASEPPTNNFGQHNNNSPHFVPVPVPVPVPLPPHPYMSSPPPRRGHFSSASTSSRTVFRDIPSPTSKLPSCLGVNQPPLWLHRVLACEKPSSDATVSCSTHETSRLHQLIFIRAISSFVWFPQISPHTPAQTNIHSHHVVGAWAGRR